MDTVYNPVKEFYTNYNFNKALPIISCTNYEDVLSNAKSVKSSCILYNKDKNIVTDKTLKIDLTFSKDVEVILVLNVELKGKSSVKISGSNFSVANLYLSDGSSSFKAPEFIVEISASNLKLINFSMTNFKCADTDKDYICVKQSATNFQMYNSALNGKTNNGVFLRLDFPLNNYIKCCTFQNFNKGSTANGGETIRMSTSGFEKKEANCTVDQCYFNNCVSDPEVVSVKCSGNTIKNCIFENNKSSKLVLRHAHKITVDKCYFSGSGMRVYGTDHIIQNIQLVDNANILLDNKTGSTYVVAENVKVNNVYYDNVKTLITNDGKNCTVTNVVKELKFSKKDLMNNSEVTPSDPSEPPVNPIIIPSIVVPNQTYKLNTSLSAKQIEDILAQLK